MAGLFPGLSAQAQGSLALGSVSFDHAFVSGRDNSITLPAATGGTPPYTYSLSVAGGLSRDNLSFDPSTRVLSGNPPDSSMWSSRPFCSGVPCLTRTITYTVTDDTGATASRANVDFHLIDYPDDFLPTPDNLNFDLDTAITPVTLDPTTSDNNNDRSYALTGLPSGLSFNPATRVLSGTPDTAGVTTVTYTSTTNTWESDITHTVTFSITVGDPPDPLALGQLRDNYAFDTGKAVTFALPAATGGTPPYTYSLSRPGGASLSSDGLSFDPSSRDLSGIPPASSQWGGTQTCSNVTCAIRGFTYTVTDDAGNTAQRTGEYRLLEIPFRFLPTPDDLNFTRNTAITPVTLPKTVDDQFTYRVSQLPPGLSFDTATRVLSGTPTETGTMEVTYTATGHHWFPVVTRSVKFDITVAGPLALSKPRNRAFTAHRTASVTLPEATGGTTPHTYSLRISPGRPLRNGLSFDPSTRVLSVAVPDSGEWSGTSGDCGDGVVCQNLRLDYKVTDAAGATVTRDFEGSIFDYPPGFLPAQDDLNFTPGTAITPVTLQQTVDKAQIYTYALTGPVDVDVSDAVPGLSFDPSSRVLSGTPTTEGTTTVTYTATHGSGAFTPPLVHTVTFDIIVGDPDDIPVTGPISIAEVDDQTYAAGASIAPLTLPAATGGTAPHTYALTGPNGTDLSEVRGLTFDSDPATRELSGTPTRAGTTTLTYTVTDSATPPVSVTRTFAVTVTGPMFDAAAIAEVEGDYPAGEVIERTLPEATGGIQPYIYILTGPDDADLSEGEVSGLTFDQDSRVLSGTPTQAGTTRLTYTVTDNEENVTSTTFDVTVTGPIFDDEVPARTWPVDEAIAPLPLPTATGADPVTYALTGPNGAEVSDAVPGLPGLTFDPATRVLSGTPTEEGATTLTWTATDTYGNATPATFVVTVTGLVPAALNEVLLPEVVRAMAGSTVGAIARRIGQAARGAEATGLSVGGQDGWAALRTHGEAVSEGRRGFEELLSGSGFVLPLNAAADGAAGASSVALWGSGEYRSLSGESGTLDWDGELVGVHLGVDARPHEDLLAGVAVSWLASDLDYEDATAVADGGFGGGEHVVELTSVHPYLGWRAWEGLDVWATAGVGEGELEVTPTGRDRRASDVHVFTVGVGGSGVLLERGVSTVRLKGEVMHSTMEVDESVHVEGVEVEATRVRMTVEAGQTHTLADGGVLEPSLEVGVRHDGGDGETGNGAELGGSVSYRHPSGRITAEGRVRALVAGYGEHEEWGIEGHLGVLPGAGGRGLSLSVRPGYGDSGEGGIGRLWRREGVSDDGDHGAEDYRARLETRLGYGLFLPGYAGVFTPYTGMTVGAAEGYRIGVSWKAGSRFDLDLVGERRESGGDPAEHALVLRGEVHF